MEIDRESEANYNNEQDVVEDLNTLVIDLESKDDSIFDQSAEKPLEDIIEEQ